MKREDRVGETHVARWGVANAFFSEPAARETDVRGGRYTHPRTRGPLP